MTVPNPMDLAVCKDMPTALWFPVKVKGQDNHGSAAKDFCKQCPALVPCLEGALERNESEGIWGGAGGDEMRNLRRAWVKGRAIPEYWQQALLRHIARLDGDTYARSSAFKTNREFGSWLEGELTAMEAAWPAEQELGDESWAEFATHFLMVTLFQERERVTAWLASEESR